MRSEGARLRDGRRRELQCRSSAALAHRIPWLSLRHKLARNPVPVFKPRPEQKSDLINEQRHLREGRDGKEEMRKSAPEARD